MKPFYLLLIILLISCKHEPKKSLVNQDYEMEIFNHYTKLKQGRVNYLELIGLHKLKNGDNTFGRSKDNSILINADVTEHIGSIIKSDSLIKLNINEEVIVTSEIDIIPNLVLELDKFGNSAKFYHNSIYWQVITRSTALYLRILDKNNPFVD